MNHRHKRWLTALRIAAIPAAGIILWNLFKDVDFAKTSESIKNLGYALPLVLLPYLLVTAFDTLGWQRVLPNSDRRIPFFRLMSIRLSTEAVLLSIPVGGAVAESLKPLLLKKRCGVPYPEGIAGVVAKKCFLGVAQGFYVVVGAILGFWILKNASEELIGTAGLEWVIVIASFGLLGIFGATSTTFLYGSMAQRLHRLLAAIPIPSLRRWLQHREENFFQTDEHLTEFTASKKRHIAPAILLFFIGWMMEAIETFLILRLLGADLSFAQIMSFEPAMSLLRALAFFMPAGLGVLDLGYVSVLQAYGMPDALATGAAFLIVKRSKELFWVIVGYSFLLLRRDRPKDILVQPA